MQTAPSTCTICGQPLVAHRVTLVGGVAHAAHLGPDGRERSCSRLEADIDYLSGRAQMLITIARGLKSIAGRMGARGLVGGEVLHDYAQKKIAESERLRRTIGDWRELWKS